MKQLFVPALVVLAAGMSAPAGAQTMKPGLWEINQHMESSGGEMEAAMAKMQQQMAAMPPAQRKIMEDAMARQGMKAGAAPGAGGGMNVQVCLTKEMVERNEMPSQQRGSCRSMAQQRIANTMKIAFVCTDPTSRGDGQITFNSPESYAMKMTVESMREGKASKMSMQATGSWRGADCGSVKPPQGTLTAK
jgi:hypothetical protein